MKTNMELDKLIQQRNIINYIKAQRLSWFGHVHRKPETSIVTKIYRVFHEECARLQEGVPYVKVYRYNPKHLCPKLNGYGDNGQRSMKL